MEHKKEPGEGQGGHTKGKGVAPFINKNGQVVGKGKDPRYGHPNHHCTRSEEQVEKPVEGDRGRQAKPKKATGKRTTERTGEVCREGGRGENIDGRAAPETPEMVEGEGVSNRT